MNICLITDSNYLIATMTAIKSLIMHNKKEHLYINIVCNKLTNNECEQIKKLGTKTAIINIINISDEFINISDEHPYVSKTALIKFLIPDILKNIDKVLYIDDDVLILSSIKKLYSIDIDNKYAAVVQDMNATLLGHAEKIGHSKYFNSGIMLLNLNKLREDNIVNKLINYKKEEIFDDFMDQNAFNKVFDENVAYISPIYNCFHLKEINDKVINEQSVFYNISKRKMKSILKKPIILHMVGKFKPWQYNTAPSFKLYLKYLFMLPCCDIKTMTIKNIFRDNYLMYFKYRLRQFFIFSSIIDIYELIKMWFNKTN